MSAGTADQEAATLYLGVDGGGTGCRARLETSEGTVLGQGFAGPAATRFGIERSWEVLMQAARAAMEEAGLDEAAVARVHAGIGVAGLGRKGARAAFEALAHPFASIAFANDGLVACLGAHAGGDGAIVICGTGSCGLGRVAGVDLRVGGYGFPISDEGSGADLGLQAIRVALRAADGRHEASALTRELLARFDDDPLEAVAWMDRATATDYATFAPLVMRHADNGDPVGRRLVQEGAEQIDGLVRALVDRGAPRVSLIGGLSSAMEAWLAPDVRRRLSPALGDAVSGAIHLAGRR
ncbi:N-acetylglucosamine kinase [Salinarimonas ramus]|uniref:N-acetylglucosamine kinase n=1 Tax=Salinarimonas ramus TaxID=690164 RepID=A0A917QG37_9HYPH|nr:N-acetylglucosamine kinase [Salinarimonas ramus]GGK48724.1 N-acetylglucosamine kinase [Salinarimonas ramus]